MEILKEDPDHDQIMDVLEEYLNREFTVQINALCSVNYQGRAKSKLDRGERLIVKKQDSAFLIHGPENYRPKNWQPEVESFSWDVEDDDIVLVASRTSPDEKVMVRLEDVNFLAVYKLVDKSDLKIRGHELDIHESIEDSPDLVEEGFKVIEREKETPAGFIDVFGRDEDDNYVVVEVKRNPDYNTVLQLQRYVDEIEDEFRGEIRGILVAPKMTDKVLDYLNERDLEFVEVDMEDVISSYDSINDSQRGLGDF
ncbi:MAG: endonuclease NucS [Candidatus Nanohaloarchaea archaeon]